jgi:hypothetical protein
MDKRKPPSTHLDIHFPKAPLSIIRLRSKLQFPDARLGNLLPALPLSFFSLWNFLFSEMDQKPSIEQAERERQDGSHSTDTEEKGVAPRNVYPIADEDYVVTFKTWIVVTILASAYGVSTRKLVP